MGFTSKLTGTLLSVALATLCYGCGSSFSAEDQISGAPATANSVTPPAPTPEVPEIGAPEPPVPPNPITLITTRFVTQNAGFNDYRPSWSPDGTTLVFERNAVPPTTNPNLAEPVKLHTVNLNTTVEAPLMVSLPSDTTRPDWSWTNRQIAFTAVNGVFNTLWIVNRDGSGLTQVVSSAFRLQVLYPHWLPDGQSLIVTDYGNGPLAASKGIVRKVVLTAGDPIVTNLTDPTQMLAGDASPSRDGRWIVLAAQSQVDQPYNQDANQIYVVDTTAPPGTPPMLFDSGQGRAPTWSPDGKTIVFESARDGGGGAHPDYAIYAKPFTGTPADQTVSATRLTDPAINAQHAVFSPDSTQLAVAARQTSGSATSPDGILLLQLNGALNNL